MKKLLLSLLILLQTLIGFCQPKLHYGNNASAGKYYGLRGINIYTEQYGNGKPLLLMHGNGGSIESMSAIIPYFSKRYRVIAVDSRSHGKSIDKGDSLSFEMMADDQAALLDKMGIDSAYIIGWSDGGIIALEMAMRHPKKIIKYAATGANLWPDSTALLPPLWLEEKTFYDSSYQKKFTSQKEKNDWKIFMLDWLQPNIQLSDLKKIESPGLIICGDRDLINLEHSLLIFQNTPHAYFWILPDSGHGTLVEHTNDFTRKVDEFFTGTFKAR